MSRRLFLVSALIIAILTTISAWAEEKGVNCEQVLSQSTLSPKSRFVSTPVIIKGERGPLIDGEKITIPVGQYIIGQDGNLVNVTGFTIEQLFSSVLKSYGIAGQHNLEKVYKCTGNNPTITVFQFFYE